MQAPIAPLGQAFQRQCMAIARALAVSPGYMLFDEAVLKLSDS